MTLNSKSEGREEKQEEEQEGKSLRVREKEPDIRFLKIYMLLNSLAKDFTVCFTVWGKS